MDLKVFCEPDLEYTRLAIQSPWVFDGWEYATDGSIVVRRLTDKKNSRAKSAPYPKACVIFEDFPACSVAWPKWGRSPVICRWCEGDGKKCPRCLGRGKIMAPAGDMELDGKRTLTRLCGRLFDAWYLGLIESQCKRLKYYLPRDKKRPLAFVAAGGVQGLLMGVS